MLSDSGREGGLSGRAVRSSLQIREAASADIPFILEVERACSTAAHWSEEQYRKSIDCVGGGPERLVLVAEIDDSLIPRTGVKNPGMLEPTQRGRDRLQSSDEIPTEVELGQGMLVAFLVARRVSGEWELENIAVSREFRRRGIGMQLLDALLALVQETKGDAVLLEVRESNMVARQLYEKSGFRETGRRRNYYADPVEDAVLYGKAIV